MRERTGLVLDPYFSGTKIEWLLRNVDGLRERAATAARCSARSTRWLVFKLTGEHVDRRSNASRTLLFDIGARRWDDELCELFGVPERALPEVAPERRRVRRDARRRARAATRAGGRHRRRPAGGALRPGLPRPGLGKNTYGTGSFVLLNAGDRAAAAPPGPARDGRLGDRRAHDYALEAAIFVTGAAVQWLRDGLGIIERGRRDRGAGARRWTRNDGVYFVPALTGLGSPHWDPYARGTIVGLTRGSGRAHLARATLEAIAYQTVDAVRAMEAASGRAARRAARRRRRDRRTAG